MLLLTHQGTNRAGWFPSKLRRFYHSEQDRLGVQRRPGAEGERASLRLRVATAEPEPLPRPTRSKRSGVGIDVISMEQADPLRARTLPGVGFVLSPEGAGGRGRLLPVDRSFRVKLEHDS